MQRVVSADGLAPSLAPYSLAVINDDTVYTAGQIGLTAQGKIVAGGVEAETKQALENLHKILQASGSNFSNVIKTTIYLTDPADFDLVNRVYGSYLTEGKYPVRETIVAASLPLGAKIEISMIAKQAEKK